MDELIPLLVLLPLFILVASIMGFIAFFKVKSLQERVDLLERQMREGARPLAKPAPYTVATSQPDGESRSVNPAAVAVDPEPGFAVDDIAARVERDDNIERVTEAGYSIRADDMPRGPIPVAEQARQSDDNSALWNAPPGAQRSAAQADSAQQPPKRSPYAFEPQEPGLLDRLADNFRQHWMIWLGGICVGLAGVFMVRYSIEQGLLGPEARVLLSLLAGVGLHGAAEWLRRNKGQNPVFASLAGGASIILYSALLAAFRLIPDTSPTLVFAAMALVSFATMALALKQGPILAALGMLGGYLVPVLVNTGSGNIAAALVYISILTLFSLWLLAYVQRRWLLNGVILGSLVWWVFTFDVTPDDGVRSLYLLVLAYLLLAVPRFDWLLLARSDYHDDTDYSEEDLDDALATGAVQNAGWWSRLKAFRRNASDWPVYPALLLIMGAQTITLMVEHVATASYITWLGLPALLLLIASRRAEFNPLPALMLPLMVAAAVYPLLTEVGDQLLLTFVDVDTQTALASRFVVLLALFVPVCVWLLRAGVAYPAFWTALGAATPLLLLAVSYYIFPDFRHDLAWGLAALVLGSGYLWLGEREAVGRARALICVILISAGHMAYALTAVIWLSEATLTLALAAQLVSLAWLHQRYDIPLLAWVIRAVLLLVLARLTLNPWLLTYDSSTHWSLWTYGGATVCTALAAWVLRAETRMQPWLQGGAAQLLVLTLATEVRYWLYDGDVFHYGFGFTEASLDVGIWGFAAVIYFWRAGQPSNMPRFYQWLGTLHLAAASAVYLFVLMLAENPLWSYAPIGDTAILNLLLLSYGVPTVIMLMLARVLPKPHGRTALMAAGLNLWWFVSLEIRHLWNGTVSLSHSTSDGELYTYSVVWLLMAAAALVLGSWVQRRGLYRAGMALLLLVVAKLFLIDMAGLTGLWRVASFMGLGLALLALAWLHQRLGGVPAERVEDSADNSAAG
ncbi:DUF2339 domain-containing protein [Parathalassolituus penaei]|uniref:DUF2339 domain-containing protein n=1 Tax=Parathalassolituus penaei TaxID=2997323 RepID=A0A9X3IQD5_9GAMM|nr:DUF2339 domain-containing protein [Parathalassolituus penaei]MCY0964057.1 DUF2339 domain-containing protein [Parathalassolituus penaei]